MLQLQCRHCVLGVSGLLDGGLEVFVEGQDLAGPLLVLDGLGLHRFQQVTAPTRPVAITAAGEQSFHVADLLACFSAASSVMATALGIISTEPPRFSEPTTMAPPRVLRSTGPSTRATITGRSRPASLRQRLVEDLDAVAGAHGHLDPVEVGAGFTGAGPDRPHLTEGQRISIDGVIAVELGGGHELLHAIEAEGVAEVGVAALAL